MKTEEKKTFDLTKRRPQVLLLGNGILRINNNDSWEGLLKNMLGDKSYLTEEKVPNPILGMIIEPNNDSELSNKIITNFSNEYQPNELLQKLIACNFDAILTTNYSYEIEYAQDKKYPSLKNDAKRKRSLYYERNSRYLLHTFNRVYDNATDVWHIHGELRRPSSIIFSHDKYARLIEKIISYNKTLKNNGESYKNEFRIKSWVDYFIFGDVYILGFGMDYSESDIWWLLSRRKRERGGTGEIIYYVHKESKSRIKVLEEMGVTVEIVKANCKNNDDVDWNVFL